MQGNSFVGNVLRERICKIRKFYDLPVKEVEAISGAMGQKISFSAVNRWELGKTLPNSEMLLTFANIFGVDMYWLLGQTDEPFNESVLLSTERKILVQELGTDRLLNCLYKGMDVTILPYFAGITVSDDYIDESRRRERFSLAVRSSIVCMLNIYKGNFYPYIADLYDTESGKFKTDPFVCGAVFGKCDRLNAVLGYLHVLGVISDNYFNGAKHAAGDRLVKRYEALGVGW